MMMMVAFLSGVLFGMGLMISHMADPNKVLAFLTLNEHWNPSLLLVMFAAVVCATCANGFVRQRSKPVCADAFVLPDKRVIDWQLLVGAVLFGLGWGLAGYCPGPALVNLVLFNPEALIFCAAMALGSVTQYLLEQLWSSS